MHIYPDILVEIPGVESDSDYKNTDDSTVQAVPVVTLEQIHAAVAENTNLERTTGVPCNITGVDQSVPAVQDEPSDEDEPSDDSDEFLGILALLTPICNSYSDSLRRSIQSTNSVLCLLRDRIILLFVGVCTHSVHSCIHMYIGDRPRSHQLSLVSGHDRV